jgi:hypothetical protein
MRVDLRRLLPEPAARVLRAMRRNLGASPMRRLCRQLRERGVDLGRLRALEVFGDDGTRHTLDYAPMVASLDIWEIQSDREATLRKNFPGAGIKIIDSFEEVKRTPNRYDLVIVDNWVGSLFDGHCEHFELFPDIYRVITDDGILVINVVPRLDEEVRRRFPTMFKPSMVAEHLERRRDFYGTDHPEAVSPEQMLTVYRKLAAENGFDIEWSVLQPRIYHTYLALKLRRAARS